MNLYPKIGNSNVVEILFRDKMISDLLESHHFVNLV